VSDGPLGTVTGVQLVAVFQSPVAGLGLHVALAAWLGWLASSKSKTGRSAALQVGLIRRESAPELEIVSVVFIDLLFYVERTARPATARNTAAAKARRSCAAKLKQKNGFGVKFFSKS
jgi:hypothetical protein